VLLSPFCPTSQPAQQTTGNAAFLNVGIGGVPG
jgi:hypothetical protein